MTTTASRTVRIATRGSKLALEQTATVARLLRERWPHLRVEPLIVSTHGDQHPDTDLRRIPLPDGVFTRAIEAEVLAGRASVAVHSLKDLPTTTHPALTLAAFPVRADPRDALVSRDQRRFSELQPGAVLGTSSPRRAAQALALRPDLRIAPIRGNVDTRLRKLDSGQYDAIILAVAGLERLGLTHVITEVLPTDRFTPAAGQAILVAQCRADDAETIGLLRPIDDRATRAAAESERAFLRALGGGCRLPIAAHAEVQGDQLTLHGFIALPDGRHAVREQLAGALDAASELGRTLAERVRARAHPEVLQELSRG